MMTPPVLFTYLTLCSISDIKYRTVSLRLSAAFALLGIFLTHKSLIAYGAGIVPGLILLTLSLIFPRHFGAGDAAAIIVCGIFSDIRSLLSCIIFSFMAAFVISLILLLTRRFSKDYALPFIPFILFGYTCVCINL